MSGFYMSNGWYDFDIVESYSKEWLKSNIDKFASHSINTSKGVGSKYPHFEIESLQTTSVQKLEIIIE
jgi:hypothetical protein